MNRPAGAASSRRRDKPRRGMEKLRILLCALGMSLGLPVAGAYLEVDKLWAGVLAGVISIALIYCLAGVPYDEKKGERTDEGPKKD